MATARLPRLKRATDLSRRAVRAARVRLDPGLAYRHLEIGKGTYIAPGCVIDPVFDWLFRIGERSTLGPQVYVLTHDATTRLSLGYTKLAAVVIGDDVFVGARSVILPGVTIGDGAIVAAGSVVRRDVPANTLVAGNPAESVMTVDGYMERQRAKMDGRPHWDRSWTLKGGITPERKREMRDAIGDGTGFVK